MTDKFGVSQEIYNDHRYVDIGDLPTGFGPYVEYNIKKLFMRPLCVRELSLIHMGTSIGSTGIQHIIRAVDMATSCDVNILTDGDFEYVMAWLRMHSYPKAPSLVRWECRRVNIVEKVGRAFYEGPDADTMTAREMELKGLKLETCNAENNEIVHNGKTEVHTLEDDDLVMPYEDLDFPRIGTLAELHLLLEDRPDLEYHAKMARWIRAGDTLDDKMRILTEADTLDQYTRIKECIGRYYHGITETLKLRCRTCGNKVTHEARPDPMTFFADNSEKDILDIQYSLLSELKLQPNDDMPAKTLLYHHSCLAKDKQAEEERARMRKAVRGS